MYCLSTCLNLFVCCCCCHRCCRHYCCWPVRDPPPHRRDHVVSTPAVASMTRCPCLHAQPTTLRQSLDAATACAYLDPKKNSTVPADTTTGGRRTGRRACCAVTLRSNVTLTWRRTAAVRDFQRAQGDGGGGGQLTVPRRIAMNCMLKKLLDSAGQSRCACSSNVPKRMTLSPGLHSTPASPNNNRLSACFCTAAQTAAAIGESQPSISRSGGALRRRHCGRKSRRAGTRVGRRKPVFRKIARQISSSLSAADLAGLWLPWRAAPAGAGTAAPLLVPMPPRSVAPMAAAGCGQQRPLGCMRADFDPVSVPRLLS
jgi:hypothetical protein